MKKGIVKYYVISWVLILALFNIVTFTLSGITGPARYSDNFWLGYILITTAFAVQLAVSVLVLTANTAKELFYNVPALKRSIAMLVGSLVFGVLFMFIPPVAGWIVLILFAAVLIINTLKLFKTLAAAEVIDGVDEKVKVQTLFIKALTADADTLVANAKSDAAKAECVKVYEAARYSDPMSNDALSDLETQITLKFDELSEAVKADDIDAVTTAAKEVTVLLKDRNNKCKFLK